MTFFLFSYGLNATDLYQVKLVVGDWGGDGHEKTKEFYIETSYDEKKILAAYRAGSKKLGFDFQNDVASEYEDSDLKKSHLKKLRDAGIEVNIEDEEEYKDQKTVPIDVVIFRDIWLHIAKLGDAGFTYELVKSSATLNIGGYGLFY